MTDAEWLAHTTRMENRETFRHQPAEPKPRRKRARHKFTDAQMAIALRSAEKQETR